MTSITVARPGTDMGRRALPALRTALRYGVSTAGPLAVSAAHFLASLIFLQYLPAREFGLFSFVMVVVAFGMSLNVSLISVPITRNLVTGEKNTRAICFQMNWLVCIGFAALLFAALLLSGAGLREAGLLALFAGVFTWRWFARCFAYVEGRINAAIGSDILYSVLLTGSLGALAWAHRVTFTSGSEVLLLAALAALLPFGPKFLRLQLAALRGHPKHYLPIFRDLTRWSLVGVVLTEITVNAHAYLVTFLAGPSAFALLALGMLMMRPASLMQSALPDMERPAMARAIAAGNSQGLTRIQRSFTIGLGAVWLGTVVACAVLLLFFPHILLKKGYAAHDVVLVALFCAAIMAVRTLRTPLAVLLQAAGEFKALAGIGTYSSIISVTATLALLLAFGPIASLGGILLGETVILWRVQALSRAWKKSHGR
jgi:O-antigen/teichoic acid export membrane protein